MIESLLRIAALAKKELLAILKDPRSRASLIVPSILQCLLYGYVATYDLTQVPYALVDGDGGVTSRALAARLDGSRIFQRVEARSLAEATRLLDERRVLLVVHVQQGFERRVRLGGPAPVQVIADGRNSNTAGIALRYVSSVVATLDAELQDGAAEAAPAVEVTTRAWFNPNLETRWYMLPSLIGTLTFIQTLVLTSMSVAREREQGTFDQLLVTPFRPAEIMAGKSLACMLVGGVQATNVLLIAQLWFRIPFKGSFLVLYAGLGLFLLAAVGLGLFVSSISRTMQQAMFYGFVVVMPFALLSGLTTPVSSMPASIRHLTAINPLRYAIEITQRVYLEGAGLDRLLPALWPLAAIAAVTLGVSSWTFRRRLG